MGQLRWPGVRFVSKLKKIDSTKEGRAGSRALRNKVLPGLIRSEKIPWGFPLLFGTGRGAARVKLLFFRIGPSWDRTLVHLYD